MHYPMYGLHPSNSFQDKRQNHWTMKYVTDLHIFYEVNLCVTLTHYSKFGILPSNSIQERIPISYMLVFQSLCFIWYAVWYVCNEIWNKYCLNHIVFKILGKITQPWNIGHSDLHLMTGKIGSYGGLVSDLMSLEGVSIKEKDIY